MQAGLTRPSFISDVEGARLHQVARRTIESAVRAGKAPPWSMSDDVSLPPNSVFVTLRLGETLRGCVGRLEARMTLAELVRDCALGAAFRDDRFPSLTPEDLADLRIDLSVLGDFRPIRGPEEVVVGQDGLLVVHEDKRGVLLPSVPVEANASAAEFVEMVFSKAGLTTRQGARAQLTAFHSQVFSTG